MANEFTSDLELQRHQFLEQVTRSVPQMIAELQEGSTLTVSRLGRRHLSDGRIMELRYEAEVIGLNSQALAIDWSLVTETANRNVCRQKEEQSSYCYCMPEL
jgi:hypothetical protein